MGAYREDIIQKAKKLQANSFLRINPNTFRFDIYDSNGSYKASYFIGIFPYYCYCSSFWDLAYCEHILAINKLELAKIIIDPFFKEPEPSRRLVARKSKRGRPKKTKGYALKKI